MFPQVPETLHKAEALARLRLEESAQPRLERWLPEELLVDILYPALNGELLLE